MIINSDRLKPEVGERGGRENARKEDKEEEEEDDDEEYDLSRFEEKLKNEGRLPFSPATHPPLEPPAPPVTTTAYTQPSPSLTEEPSNQNDARLSDGEISDIESDGENATFRLLILILVYDK